MVNIVFDHVTADRQTQLLDTALQQWQSTQTKLPSFDYFYHYQHHRCTKRCNIYLFVNVTRNVVKLKRLCRMILFAVAAVVLSQYTRVTDDRETDDRQHLITSGTLQCNCNVPLKTRAYCRLLAPGG